MSYTIANKYLFLGSLIVILAIFFGGWYIGSSRDKKALNTTIEAQKQEIQKLTVQINDTEYQVTKVEQELATEKELRKKDIFEKKELKALNLKQANEITKMKLRIDTLLEDVEHNGQIIGVLNSQLDSNIAIKDTAKKQKAILLPFSFPKEQQIDQWLYLNGNFDKNGVLDIKLKIDFNADLIVGLDKKTKKNVALLKTNCPYIRTVTFESIKIGATKKRNYNLSVFAGYGITNSLHATPLIGIGIGRTIMAF